jgi:hypothetical protein
MTRDQLLEVMPLAGKRIDSFLTPLNVAMDEFEINTVVRNNSINDIPSPTNTHGVGNPDQADHAAIMPQPPIASYGFQNT